MEKCISVWTTAMMEGPWDLGEDKNESINQQERWCCRSQKAVLLYSAVSARFDTSVHSGHGGQDNYNLDRPGFTTRRVYSGQLEI